MAGLICNLFRFEIEEGKEGGREKNLRINPIRRGTGREIHGRKRIGSSLPLPFILSASENISRDLHLSLFPFCERAKRMWRMWRGTVKTLVGRTYVVLVLRNTSIARRLYLLGSFLDLLAFSNGSHQKEFF